MGKSSKDTFSKIHTFRAYRTALRFIGAPLVIACSVVDFAHMPSHAPSWLMARIFLALYVWASFYIMAKFAKARRQIGFFLGLLIILLSGFCNLTIYDSGGVVSPYLPGLCVASSGIILMFRLGRLGSVLSQLVICGPAIFIMYHLSEPSQLMSVVVAGSFYLCMVGVAAMGTVSSEELQKVFQKAYRTAKTEIERHRRSEFLKNHFPPNIREQIESGTFSLNKKEVVRNAVVGFADIIGSTEIGNNVDLDTDWELKEKFLASTTKRATECGMVVLNQMGDGIFFLANYQDSKEWNLRLIKFYEQITFDLNDILIGMRDRLGTIQSGIKFGVASGPMMLGWIGEGQSYFTGMGPTVNLAARLCAVAGNNEIVVTSSVASEMGEVIKNRATKEVSYSNLKGFNEVINTLHISCIDISYVDRAFSEESFFSDDESNVVVLPKKRKKVS
jgi:adenylate cyclase